MSGALKLFVAAVAALIMATAASPAMAYVVVVTTSVLATNVRDETQLEAMVDSAIQDVLSHAVAFTPTLVTLENARLVGDRIYLVLLIADADGEKSIEAALSALRPAPEEPANKSAAESPRLTF